MVIHAGRLYWASLANPEMPCIIAENFVFLNGGTPRVNQIVASVGRVFLDCSLTLGVMRCLIS